MTSETARLKAELEARTADLERLRRSSEVQREELLKLTQHLRAARDEAHLANAAKSNFLAVMSHELRTPLNAIIGFSDIIKNEMFGPIENERYRDYVHDIEGSAKHLLSLINDILDISKIEAGRFEINEEDVDLSESVEAALRFVRERAMTGGLSLAVDLSASLPRVLADSRAIRQILLNLLSNAVKFTPRGGKVWVRAWVDEERGMIVSVRDTGIGIAASDIQLALTPFGQADTSLARQYEGTGLGLPLSKQLVELHNGVLELESQLGTGTEVRVVLPGHRIIAGFEAAARG